MNSRPGIVRLRIFSSVVLAVLSGAGLMAQTSSLQGTVRDPSGQVVPGASAYLTNEATSVTRETVTDDIGFYQFVQVPPGTYSVRVELDGFKTAVRENTRLLVDSTITLDIELQLGDISEVVTVTAEQGTLVNSVDASVGNNFNEVQVQNLPLLTRNVVELLSLQPGVNQSGEVSGSRFDQNNVNLDGVDVNDQQSPAAFESVLPVPLDSVQEFRVTTLGSNAVQGRSSGGQVSLVTKSGTNSWHGSLYEFHRNTVTAANTFFNNANDVERSALIRNQFGFSVGGPIKKDRAFFFFNFENRRDSRGSPESRTVPSEALRQGVLTFRAVDAMAGEETIQTLTPDELALVDPAGIGNSAAMLQILNSYPAGNAPTLGLDLGLNFSGIRFNAPLRIDRKAYVAKFDFNLSENHRLSWRGTLADNKEDRLGGLAQFPGQGPRGETLNNSRGFAAQYNTTFSPRLVNTFTYGYTRQGLESSGVVGDVLVIRSMSHPTGDGPRGFGRTVPVHNINNDLSWLAGNHTLQAGINFRLITNDRFSFAESYYRYVINNGFLFGLGLDLVDNINAYIQQRSGNPNLAVQSATPVIRAAMATYGVISQGDFTFQFDRSGTALPRGAAQVRNFATQEYDFYVQDAWKITPTFTLTYGMRYGVARPPYETTGLQVAPTVSLGAYFAERAANALQSIPSNASDLLTFELNGPENGRDSWYDRDDNNFSPRVAFAWNPGYQEGFLGALMGGDAVLRGGVGVAYDRFGGELIVNFDRLGSVGVSTAVGYPSFDYVTAPRFNGTFPAPPDAPTGGFPNTPALNFAIGTNTYGISDDLVAPYSFPINFSYARELPGDLSLEVGYLGRLGRKNLAQLDIMSPLNYFVDPESGQNWIETANFVRDLYVNGGLTTDAIAADPSLVPTIAYAENIFPSLAAENAFIDGSASANLAFILGFFLFSEADGLHFLDRNLCAARFGCHTFFGLQYSTMPTWFNAGISNYHAGTLSVRRRFQKGVGFDFNYTWAHSIDNGSSAETGAGQFGGVILDIFDQSANRGNSDFDIRHQFNSNFIWELPFGRGRSWGANVQPWVNQVIGGWQLTGIARYQTGLPTGVGTGFNFTTNYFLTGRGVPTRPIETSIGTNDNGVPGVFVDRQAAVESFRQQRVGETGPRNYLRLDDFFTMDLGLTKAFNLPWEGHRLVFRWEMFNAFNNVNFDEASISLEPFDAPARFGQFEETFAPREMQFALRYEF